QWTPNDFLEPGAMNYEALVGVTEMVQFFSDLGDGTEIRDKVLDTYSKISMYEAYLMNILKQGLSTIPFVRLFQGKDTLLHIPILAFTIEGIEAKLVSHYLSQDFGIHVDFGHFGLPEYVQSLTNGEESLVRISLAPYNTVEEIEHLLTSIKALEKRIK